MDKKLKITKESIPAAEVVELEGRNGDKVEVERHIPYGMKEALAAELDLFLIVTDAEQQLMYNSYKRQLMETVLIVKHYTNIDVSGMEQEEDWRVLFDYLTYNDLYGRMMDVIHEDYAMVKMIAEDVRLPTKELFDRKNSLAYKVSTMFGSLLDSPEDLTEAIAKSAEVNNTAVEILGAYKEKREETRQKNEKKGMKLDNGTVISFAKKK